MTDHRFQEDLDPKVSIISSNLWMERGLDSVVLGMAAEDGECSVTVISYLLTAVLRFGQPYHKFYGKPQRTSRPESKQVVVRLDKWHQGRTVSDSYGPHR